MRRSAATRRQPVGKDGSATGRRSDKTSGRSSAWGARRLSALAVLACGEFTASDNRTSGQSGVILVRRSMTVGLFSLLLLGLVTPAWAQDGRDGQASEAFVV